MRLNELPPAGDPIGQLLVRYPSILPEVERFTFRTYRTRPSMLEVSMRLAVSSSKHQGNLGWLGIQDKKIPAERVDEAVGLALRHEHSEERPMFMPSSDVGEGRFAAILAPERHPSIVLAMSTRCLLRDGSEAHLPMLDFQCSPDSYFVMALQSGLKRISPGGGAIIHSGRSLHFYGFQLMTEARWRHFMYRALLLAPLTDSRYVAHRLIDGHADLRITASMEKPTTPTIAAYVDA